MQPGAGEQSQLQPAEETVVFNYLDGVGNHEIKNLLASCFLADPSTLGTASEMACELGIRQGEHPAWQRKAVHIIQYCALSLEPVGAVIEDEKVGASGKKVTAWKAAPDNIDLKLALSGLISDWSLRWPDLSVQQVYGATTSRSDQRSPRARHAIYGALLEADEDATLWDISRASGGEDHAAYQRVHGHLATLVVQGLVNQKTKHRDYNPIVRVTDTQYSHIAIEFEDTLPETQALYRAVGQLGTDALITINDLISRAETIDAEIDTVKLRRKLRNAVTSGHAFRGLQLLDHTMAADARSQVSLEPAAEEPIKELTEGITSLHDRDAQNMYRERAQEILSTPADFRTLVAKARQFSSNANSLGMATLRQDIGAIVREQESATVEQVQQALANSGAKAELSITHVRAVLRELVSSGDLMRQRAPRDPHSKKLSNVYSINPKKFKA